jgi:hypothetical protein
MISGQWNYVGARVDPPGDPDCLVAREAEH